MNTVEHFSFKERKALIRVDFNVPLDADLNISDDSRIRATLPTLKKILNDGGACILMSHLGRPKDGAADKYSLRHLVKRIEELTQTKVYFAPDCIGDEARLLAEALQPGEILLLENLRFYKEEEKGDAGFAEKLAKLGNFYVNDAFGTAHRAHASTAVIASFFPGKCCFGLVMSAEIENADRVLKNPQHPFTAIVGGAKVSDKLLIIENLLAVANHIIIGGGMAYTFAKAQGGTIGTSLCEDDRMELCLKVLQQAKEKGVELHLPVDSIASEKFDNESPVKTVNNMQIPDGWMGLDIGPQAIEDFRQVILKSNTILWNGPMGVFEKSNFEAGTRETGKAVAEATRHGAFSLIGGGDSAAAVHKFGLSADVSYVSTGGGALLEYFEGKSLPGIQAIEKASPLPN